MSLPSFQAHLDSPRLRTLLGSCSGDWSAPDKEPTALLGKRARGFSTSRALGRHLVQLGRRPNVSLVARDICWTNMISW